MPGKWRPFGKDTLLEHASSKKVRNTGLEIRITFHKNDKNQRRSHTRYKIPPATIAAPPITLNISLYVSGEACEWSSIVLMRALEAGQNSCSCEYSQMSQSRSSWGYKHIIGIIGGVAVVVGGLLYAVRYTAFPESPVVSSFTLAHF